MRPIRAKPVRFQGKGLGAWGRWRPGDPLDSQTEPSKRAEEALLDWAEASLRGNPCPYPCHRSSDWLNAGGRRVCGVCHPPVGPVFPAYRRPDEGD